MLGHSSKLGENWVWIPHPDFSERELKPLFDVSQRNVPVADLGGWVRLGEILLSCHKKVLSQI